MINPHDVVLVSRYGHNGRKFYRTGESLSPMQLKVLREVGLHGGSIKEAAACCKIALQTTKNHLRAVYTRLGVGSFTDAFRVMGWLNLDATQGS
jgi:DNA-binding CsgD family transcriptional regulator